MEAWQLNRKQAALKYFLQSQKDNILRRATTDRSVVAGDRKHTYGLVCFQGFLFYFHK